MYYCSAYHDVAASPAHALLLTLLLYCVHAATAQRSRVVVTYVVIVVCFAPQLESFKNFDFEMWRQRYVSWIRAKKFRITDFFRKQDKDGDGVLTRTEFVDGMINSRKSRRACDVMRVPSINVGTAYVKNARL